MASSKAPRTVRIPALFLFAAVLLHAGFAFSAADIKDRVSETTLANGLKVLLLEDHKAPVVTFQVWYRVGSRNEQWGKTGLSHVLEHMMFKGTKKVPGARFSRIVEENGGNFNAFTSNDFTAYFETMSASRIAVSIRLEADRMRGLILRPKDFTTERQVVMEERRLRTEDSPTALLAEQVNSTAFQVHPYHWPVIGWMEDLAHLTVSDLKRYYGTHYQPNNAFLVVVGDFKKDPMLASIRKTFGVIKKGRQPSRVWAVEPAQAGERRTVVRKEAQLSSLIMAYHVPNLKDPDAYVLEVVAGLLSAGESSRLYRDLVREKRIALSIGADQPLLSKDPDLFTISGDVVPGKTVAELEQAIEEQITRLATEPVPDRELQKVKNQVEASFTFGQDSVFSQAMLLAQHEIALDWKALDSYLPNIRKVSADDVKRVVAKYLVPANRTVGILDALPPSTQKPAGPTQPSKEKIIR